MNKFHVMFLCTGNSCRSQMAEGWMRTIAGDSIDSKSAGIEAHGQNERAIRSMAEVGVDISQQQSIRINGEMLEWADILVTLCDNAEEQCPVMVGHTVKIHLPLSDPAKLKGSEDELMSEFASIRDQIRQRVEHVIQQLDQVA
jgi:arsenate reductase